jgi:NAD(P)-dependent dehydrogenase (short-subunit alcohol dehydrogenase family)
LTQIGLSGRRALVTGSTAGIGYATAGALAAAGAAVVVNGRTPERVDDAVSRLRSDVPAAEFVGVPADVGSADGVSALLDSVPDADILVINAGVFEPKPFAEIPDEDWQHVFDVNVMSGVRLARHYVPRMVENGWGRAVFISSESALHIPAEMIHYGMSKTAMLAVARGIAETYPGTGVTINSVLPGPTRTEGVGQMLDSMASEKGISREEAERSMIVDERPTSLIQRLATPEEVASMITYVCSPQASATTGAALRVDGGVVRAIP